MDTETINATISAMGGFVDVGQTVDQAYAAETSEETNFASSQMRAQSSTQVSMDRSTGSTLPSKAKGVWGVTANGLTLDPETVSDKFQKVQVSVAGGQKQTAYVRISSDGKKEILVTKKFAVAHSRDSYFAVGVMVADTTE